MLARKFFLKCLIEKRVARTSLVRYSCSVLQFRASANCEQLGVRPGAPGSLRAATRAHRAHLTDARAGAHARASARSRPLPCQPRGVSSQSEQCFKASLHAVAHARRGLSLL
jgi:hypothetical protein